MPALPSQPALSKPITREANTAQHVRSSTRPKRKRGEEAADKDIGNEVKRLKLSSDPDKSCLDTKRPSSITRRINLAPTAPLDVFVFGEGAGGELGLGSKMIGKQSPCEVMRPRLNPLLSAKDVGVVQISCGGLHGIALTKNNEILTWGVNDHGALGRDACAEEEDDDLLNPLESTPRPIDTSGFDRDIRWAQVVGCDNASFALTEDGRVYGWGTFRGSNSVMGFREVTQKAKDPEVQRTPCLIPELGKITQLAAGNNHVLALDIKGKVYTWGCGEQYQIGREVRVDHPESALKPICIGPLPMHGAKAVKVACGSFHSFALDQEGRVFAWGLNNFAQLAIPDQVGESHACQTKPRLVESLQHYQIIEIAGGLHHSLAVTADGKLLTWGRIDGYQVGHRRETFTKENTIFDEHGKPRILKEPTVIPHLRAVASGAAGTDHSFALTADGKAYSWGFSCNGRTGHNTDDDIEVPALIDCNSVRDRNLSFADAGGPFSILASVAS